MNRATFLKRALGALAALFVPWKVEAAENIPPIEYWQDENEPLLKRLQRERTKKIVRGYEPRSFGCSNETASALVNEMGCRDPLGEYQALKVMDLPWIPSQWLPYGKFQVNCLKRTESLLTKEEARA